MDGRIISDAEGMEDNGNKVVFITGGSLGIGRESVYEFSRAGWRVAFSYFEHQEESREVVKRGKELGTGDVIAVSLDVRDDNSIRGAVDDVVNKYVDIDVLINNAGVIVTKKFEEQTFAEIENQVRINLEGQLKLINYCLPHVTEKILNVSSSVSKNGKPGVTTYSATKFGIRGFSQALAREMEDIEVYNINPGRTKTRMTDFTGVEPSEVAKVIFDVANDKYLKMAGGDIDVWEVLRT